MLFPVRYLLVSNFGAGNAGDEMLRAYFLRRFPEVTWQVLSARPQSGGLPRVPAGMSSLLSLGWIRTAYALARSSGLVFSGGSLWTDSESLRSCIIWTLH